MDEQVGVHSRAVRPEPPPLREDFAVERHVGSQPLLDAQPQRPVDRLGIHLLLQLIRAPLADGRVAEELGLVHQHLADHAGLELFADEGPQRQARGLHADLHHLARLFPGPHDLHGLVDRVRHGLFTVDVQAGLHAVDRLRGVPMVGRRDADGVELFLGDHVAVIDVLGDRLAGLTGDRMGGPIAVDRIDVAHGGQLDVLSRFLQAFEGADVRTVSAAAGTDEPDPQDAVRIGGLRRAGGDGQAAQRAGGNGRGPRGLEEVPTIDVRFGHEGISRCRGWAACGTAWTQFGVEVWST